METAAAGLQLFVLFLRLRGEEGEEFIPVAAAKTTKSRR